MFYFFFITFFIRTQNNLPIKNNPIILSDTQNPIVLSSTDENYYVITSGQDLKINKYSGDKENTTNNVNNYLYIFDNSNNNYIYFFDDKKYYYIKYNSRNPFISYVPITVNCFPKGGTSEMTIIGSIAKNDEFIIYGRRGDYLLFSSKSQYYRAFFFIENLNDKLSCKFIEDENYVCAMIPE